MRLGGKPSGQYTNYDTLSNKVESLIQAGIIQSEEIPLLPSLKACLNWDIIYQIYDCLYVHGALTATEIGSMLSIHRPPGIINHTLKNMSHIGITKPVNYENLTSADVPRKRLSILPILHKLKKWELTASIRE